jgi:hypothetical protein
MMTASFVSLGLGLLLTTQAPESAPKLIDLTMISDAAPHSAFTDLIRYRDRWVCAFREGQGHVSPDGAIRVMVSDNGTAWKTAARLTRPDSDLRDPKLSITPGGKLMLASAGAMHDPKPARHRTFAWLTDDPATWGDPVEVGVPDLWLWRVDWHESTGLGVAYATTGPDRIMLFRADAARPTAFTSIVDPMATELEPNETTVRFRPDGEAFALVRREKGKATALLGRSRPPYAEWTWKDLGVKVGGPNFVILPDGRMVAAVRLYDRNVRTSLCDLDPELGTLIERLPLPSGGDCSYAGLAWHQGRLWVSYYSSHEGGKARIYRAEVAW